MTTDFYFLLDGISSLTYGIELVDEPPIVMPEERGEHVTVLGRTGDLFIPESEDEAEPVYEPYLVTLNAGIEGEERVERAMNWLRGDHSVTFCNQPERRQLGRILAGTQFTRVSAGLNWFTGKIVIKCQPDKFRRASVEQTLVSGSSLINAGDLTEHPLYTVTGTGDFSLSVDDGAPLTLTVDGTAYIDCETMRAYDASGFLVTGGAFPHIKRGSHAVTFTQGFTVSAYRRERFR